MTTGDSGTVSHVSDDWPEPSTGDLYRQSVGGSDLRVSAHRHGGLAALRKRLIITDTVVITSVMLLGLLISARASTWAIDPLIAVYGVPVAVIGLWLGMLAMRGSYDRRIVGLGTEEITRVVSATLFTFAFVAGVSYLMRADISRAYAFLSLPLGLCIIIVLRFYWRGWLYRQRLRGRFMHPTVLIGSGDAVLELSRKLSENAYAGYEVVAILPDPSSAADELQGWLIEIEQAIVANGAEAIAMTPSGTLSSTAIRELAWRIEGRGIDLLIAPTLHEAAGPRLSVRPAAGLPLLHLDEATLSRSDVIAKRSLDLIGSLIMIVILSPLLLISAAGVRLTSRGPVIYRQTRIGLKGKPFTMLKFRSMVDGADELRQGLRDLSGNDRPMFKAAADPRITPFGRFLRRWSLDELPQLFNVLAGSMSLVGPRPHPLDDVDRYESEAFRRLALKPGITGLWQVEGRSDLDWAAALQLDLYYVETWTLFGDLVLLARTVRAVLQGRGAR